MIRTIATIIVLGAIGWFIGSPYYAAYSMKTAADANNTEKLAQWVNFEALQSNAKQNIQSMIDEKIQDKSSLLSKMSKGIGQMISDKMVETAITPQGLAELLRGKQMLKEGNTQIENRSENPNSEQESASKDDQINLGYKGWDSFAIDLHNTPSTTTRLLLTREGLSWRLTNIQLIKPS